VNKKFTVEDGIAQLIKWLFMTRVWFPVEGDFSFHHQIQPERGSSSLISDSYCGLFRQG